MHPNVQISYYCYPLHVSYNHIIYQQNAVQVMYQMVYSFYAIPITVLKNQTQSHCVQQVHGIEVHVSALLLVQLK